MMLKDYQFSRVGYKESVMKLFKEKASPKKSSSFLKPLAQKHLLRRHCLFSSNTPSYYMSSSKTQPKKYKEPRLIYYKKSLSSKYKSAQRPRLFKYVEVSDNIGKSVRVRSLKSQSYVSLSLMNKIGLPNKSRRQDLTMFTIKNSPAQSTVELLEI